MNAQLIPAKEHRVESQFASNRYVGTGIALQMNDQMPLMGRVIPGGLAARAGARNGDMILEIDGVSTRGKKLTHIVDMLRGPRGSSVDVTLRHLKADPVTSGNTQHGTVGMDGRFFRIS